uniref:Anthocyanin acyltransferase n=1 Tax=Fagus sylvatica TaxID=28930 RepID=A0A2N9GYH0_FAGSY
MCPPPPTKPYILYNNGDSIPLTIAECTINFNHFISNHPRDIIEFDQLVPKLPPIHISNETFVIPLLALQVTILPNSGICIGITYRHVVDGLTSIHFMKLWASIFSGKTCLEKFLPYYDRDVIKDTNGVEAVLLDEYFRMRSSWKDFILDVDEVHYFVFPADCRDRLEYPVPKTYFGNCLALCVSEAKKSELVATNGVAVAATAIDKAISKLQSGPLKGAERWISDLMNLLKLGRMCTVTGSPSLGFYETDFGWGSPKKVEMVNQQTKNISLSECGDEKGGIEVGLMQTKSAMDTFSSIFEQSLNFLN